MPASEMAERKFSSDLSPPLLVPPFILTPPFSIRTNHSCRENYVYIITKGGISPDKPLPRENSKKRKKIDVYSPPLLSSEQAL